MTQVLQHTDGSRASVHPIGDGLVMLYAPGFVGCVPSGDVATILPISKGWTCQVEPSGKVVPR